MTTWDFINNTLEYTGTVLAVVYGGFHLVSYIKRHTEVKDAYAEYKASKMKETRSE